MTSRSSSSSALSFRDQHHLAQCHCFTLDDGALLCRSPACSPNPDSTCPTASWQTVTVGGFTHVQTASLKITPEVRRSCWVSLAASGATFSHFLIHIHTSTQTQEKEKERKEISICNSTRLQVDFQRLNRLFAALH